MSETVEFREGFPIEKIHYEDGKMDAVEMVLPERITDRLEALDDDKDRGMVIAVVSDIVADEWDYMEHAPEERANEAVYSAFDTVLSEVEK